MYPKLRKLVLALGGVGLVSPAFALVPLSVDPVNGVAPDIEVNIAGATASDPSIESLIINNLCDAGTVDVFRDNGANPGAAYRAFFCRMSNVTGIPANSAVLIRKRSAGGSAQGVGPVCDNLTQAYMKLQPSCTFLGNPAPPTNLAEWRCPNTASDQEQLEAEIGISDVGPSEVQASASANCGSPGGSFALVFGMPVTKKLRDALQVAQGLTSGSELPEDMPSLSYDQVRSLYTGRINTWDDFKVNGVALTAVPGVVPPTGTNPNRVTICRRVDTSGTFASYALHILGRTCLGGAALPHAPQNNLGGNPAVILNSGSGNVEVCLDTLNDTGTIASQSGITVGAGATFSDWAIGMQSTDFGAPVNGVYAFDYRHIRLGGVIPSIDNAAAGTYSFVMVSTIQQSTTFPPSPESTIIYNALQAAVTPANLSAINRAHEWGVGGALALATNGFAIDPDNNNLFDPANPVWPYIRSSSAAAPFAINNCVGPYLVPGTVGGGGETQLGPNRDALLDGEI
jgi:hypothetical protein